MSSKQSPRGKASAGPRGAALFSLVPLPLSFPPVSWAATAGLGCAEEAVGCRRGGSTALVASLFPCLRGDESTSEMLFSGFWPQCREAVLQEEERPKALHVLDPSQPAASVSDL